MLRASSVRAARSVLHSQGKHTDLNAFISQTLTHRNGVPLTEPDGQRDPEKIRLDKDTSLLAVKDNIATANLRTTCASGTLEGYQSPFEATVTERLWNAGATVNGKTNLDEFGMGSHSVNSFFGPVRNDSFDKRSAGGSSGGSAVAVAAQQCDIALGTDTGGSVRLPASYIGVVGFKPSYGFVSRWGVIPYANSLDTVGILGRTTKKVQRLFELAQGHDPHDPTSVTSASLKRIKTCRKRAAEETGRLNQRPEAVLQNATIGIPIEYNIEELDPGVRQAWQKALESLQSQGCTVVPVSLPNTKHALSAYYVLAPAEAASNLAKYDGVRYGARSATNDSDGDVLYSKTRGDGFGEEVKRRILLGSYTLSSEAIDNYFIKAQKIRRLVQRDFDRVFALPNPLRPTEQFDLSDMDDSIALNNKLGPPQVDFIVCPTAPTLPPTLSDISKQSPVDTYMNDVFTVPASLAGLPAISIPFPVPNDFQQTDAPAFAGIQIIGQYSDDHRVLNAARVLEEQQTAPIRPNISYVRMIDTKSRRLIDKQFAQSKHREAQELTIRWQPVDPENRLNKTQPTMPIKRNKRIASERKVTKQQRSKERSRKFILKKYYGRQILRIWWQRSGRYLTPSNQNDASVVNRTMGNVVRKYISEEGRGGPRITKHPTFKGESRRSRLPRSPKEVDLALGHALGMWENLKESQKG